MKKYFKHLNGALIMFAIVAICSMIFIGITIKPNIEETLESFFKGVIVLISLQIVFLGYFEIRIMASDEYESSKYRKAKHSSVTSIIVMVYVLIAIYLMKIILI